MNTAKKPRYHSIQAKITYPVVGLFIFFIVAIYFLATYIYNRTITRQSETTIKAMSQQVISNYDTYFESVIKVSDAIQAKIDYLDLSTSKKEVSSYLDEIMSIQSPIYNISIYSATGGFVVGNTDYTDPPIDASGEAWFTKALNNQLVNNFSPVSVYSSEDPLFTVSKHVYYNQEKNEGVMKMEYSFSKIVSLIARTDLGDGGNILITDKDDNLVYASVSPVPEAEKKLADSLVFGMSSYTNSGSSYLLYVSTIQNTTWSAAIATNNNALYIVVIAFFIACSIITPITQGYQLLTINNLVSLIDNASTRVFFALGVGGLILLGGTDLSIGRIIGMGTFIVGFVLHSSSDGTQATHFFKLTSTVGGSLGGRIILAFVLTLAACVFFSALAGFFSARFKMHPFITTLSTMMVIYGLMMVATAGIPTGPVDKDLAQAVVGHIKFEGDTGPGFPKYLIYAVIAVAICWFIWNKTKFGKDIYAVGGNPEAAAVSGISYFKVTLGVFILAGVFYGIGCFLYGFASNPAANNGYGYELDAIAACVVGGISFFGGIGKVKGAVIGVLIFSGLSTVLTIMNVSSYWQFVIKGLILMTAVALDSVKYLKRK
jgi:ABC-type glucose/galactose transport system permease subunit